MFKDASPFVKLVLLAFVTLVSYLVFYLFSGLFAWLIFRVNMFDPGILQEMTRNTAFMKYFQIVQSAGVFVVPPVVLAWLFDGRPGRYLFLEKAPRRSSVFLVFCLLLLSLPVMNFLIDINSRMVLPDFLSSLENWMKKAEEDAGRLTDRFLQVSTAGGFLVNLLMIAVIPAIGEELMFRGIIQRIFTEWTKSRHAGVLIAAALFSASHFQFYGFLPRLMLGIFLGYLLLWSGTIWLPVAAHFINNSLAVMFYFVAGKELTTQIEEAGAATGNVNDMLLLIGSTVMVCCLVFLIFRKEKRVLQ